MRGKAPRFTDIPEDEIKRNPEKYSRQEIDPEFLEELKKQDFAKQMRIFQARPIRNDPERMELKKINTLQEKLTKRELKKREYVRQHRLQQKLKYSIRHRLRNEYDRLKEVELSSQGRYSEQRGYHALVYELSKQPERIEAQGNSVQVYEEGEKQIAQNKKKMDENFQKAKKVVWRAYAAYFVVSLIMAIGMMGQVKEFQRGETLIDLKKRVAKQL